MIIAIDGLDGSGKETLAHALKDTIVDRYDWNPDNVLVHSFPCYTNDSGYQIKSMLSGNTFNMPISNLKLYMIGAMFAYNRAEYISNMQAIYGIECFNAKSMIHIFDRYWGSNVIYQGLGKSGEDLDHFIQLMRGLDVSLKNPMPDRYYFLRHPYGILRERIANRKSKSVEHDTYEQDTFQKAVYHLSEYLLEKSKPPMNPIYNVVLEGVTPITRSDTVSTYMQKTVQELVAEILTDLKQQGILLGGEK